MKFTKYDSIAFVSGACVMILEILGSRLIAPYLGSTIYVWSSLIGIVLFALSIGYYVGGRVADKYPKEKVLAQIVLFSAVTTILIPLLLPSVGKISMYLGIKIGGILISFILFFLPAFFLGMVSPYLIRLNTKKIKKVGASAGRIYAIGTIGSIIGTFATGFVLIPNLGTVNIIYLMGLLLLSNFLLLMKKNNKTRIAFFLVVMFLSLGYGFFYEQDEKIVYLKDTEYYQIKVVENEEARKLYLDNQIAGAMELETGELYFEYTKYTKIVKYLKEDAEEILFIGAGACSEQNHLLRNMKANVDTVEIDPEVFYVCEEYFGYSPNERTKEIVEDGRIYLYKSEKKYDIIRVDVYNTHYQIPFHLTTIETVELIKEDLKEGGIVLINLIGTIEGENSEFFKSELKTYKEKFKNAYVFLEYPEEQEKIQNIIIFISDMELDFEKVFKNQEIKEFEDNYVEVDYKDGIILTDDYAPVENMIEGYMR